MTTLLQIKDWLRRGKHRGAKWMIVASDTFEYREYPVYATTDQQFWEQYKSHDDVNMQRIMESYNIEKPWEPQLALFRCHEKPETRY